MEPEYFGLRVINAGTGMIPEGSHVYRKTDIPNSIRLRPESNVVWLAIFYKHANPPDLSGQKFLNASRVRQLQSTKH